MGNRSNENKKAQDLYDKILKDEIIPVVGDSVTWLNQLNNIAIELFGIKFKGVFPSDKIPKLNEIKKYCILNLDKSHEPGSHWVALAKEGNKSLFYDSFGRRHTEIIENLSYSGNGRVINTHKDAEQDLIQQNCGARCLAWLVLFDRYGFKIAKRI